MKMKSFSCVGICYLIKVRMMKDKKYRRGLQNMDVDKEEKQPISIKKILESNEMDYEKFEDIYDPILETELTTEDSPISKILDYEEKEEDREGEDDEEEASVFSQRLWNSFLQKIKNWIFYFNISTLEVSWQTKYCDEVLWIHSFNQSVLLRISIDNVYIKIV